MANINGISLILNNWIGFTNHFIVYEKDYNEVLVYK